MSQVKIQGNASGTGIFTVAAPNSNTDRTLTLPDSTGTMALTSDIPTAGSGPAFSATVSTNQSISNGVWTKITFNTEQFDTNSNFDSSTNYRFTPTVAGYYQINLILTSGTAGSFQAVQTAIYKNGSANTQSSNYLSGNYYWAGAASASAIVYLNGSTDYVEGYAYMNGGSATYVVGGADNTKFSGALVRVA